MWYRTPCSTLMLRWRCLSNNMFIWENDGGAERNRTADLLIANETLYQLSYGPRNAPEWRLALRLSSIRACAVMAWAHSAKFCRPGKAR